MTYPKNQLELGDNNEAKAWIGESTLSPHCKDVMCNFVDRFPTFEFYRENDELLDEIEKKNRIVLPNSLRAIRKTIAFVGIEEDALIQLNTFDAWTPRLEYLKEMWFRFDLIGYVNPEQRELLQQQNLLPIADCRSENCSTLAVDLSNANGLQIFEFCEDDLWDNVADEISPFESSRLVYNSYIDIFEHIRAIKRSDGTIIRAMLG